MIESLRKQHSSLLRQLTATYDSSLNTLSHHLTIGVTKENEDVKIDLRRQIDVQERRLKELDRLVAKRRQLRNLLGFIEEGERIAKDIRSVEEELGMTDEDVQARHLQKSRLVGRREEIEYTLEAATAEFEGIQQTYMPNELLDESLHLNFLAFKLRQAEFESTGDSSALLRKPGKTELLNEFVKDG